MTGPRLEGALYVVVLLGMLALGLVQWILEQPRNLYFRIVDGRD